jgi:hypothetical protein
MAIAFDSSWGVNFNGASASLVLATHAPTAASSTVMGWLYYTSANTLTGINDSVSGAVPAAQIVNLGTATGPSAYSCVFYYYNINTNTTRTITFGFNSSATKSAAIGFAFTGLASTNLLDLSPQGATGSGTVATSPTTATTNAANELVLFCPMIDSVSSTTFSFTGVQGINGWGQTHQFNGLGSIITGNIAQFDAGYLVVSQVGTGNGSITSSVSAPWMGNIVTMSATPILPPPTNSATGSGVDKFIPRLLRRRAYVTRQQKVDRKKMLDEWASKSDIDSQES